MNVSSDDIFAADDLEFDMLVSDKAIMVSISLSSFATFLVLILVTKTKLYKEPFGFMVFWVIFTDFLMSFPRLVAAVFPPQNELTCRILLSITHFGLISSLFWSSFFGHALLTFLKTEDVNAVSKVKKYYIFFAVFCVLLHSAVVLITDYIQYSDKLNTCVHHKIKGELDMQVMFFTTAPMAITFALSLFWYLLAAFKIRSVMRKGHGSQILKIMLYPAILFICWTPYSVANLMVDFGLEISCVLVKLARSIGPLQGFLDCVIFGSSRRFFREVKCKSLCNCLKRKEKKPRLDTSVTLSLAHEEVKAAQEEEEALKQSLLRRKFLTIGRAPSNNI